MATTADRTKAQSRNVWLFYKLRDVLWEFAREKLSLPVCKEQPGLVLRRGAVQKAHAASAALRVGDEKHFSGMREKQNVAALSRCSSAFPP